MLRKRPNLHKLKDTVPNLPWRDDHSHQATFGLWVLFNLRDFGGFCLDAFEQTEIESQFHANFRTTVWIDRELLMDFQAARRHGNDGK